MGMVRKVFRITFWPLLMGVALLSSCSTLTLDWDRFFSDLETPLEIAKAPQESPREAPKEEDPEEAGHSLDSWVEEIRVEHDPWLLFDFTRSLDLDLTGRPEPEAPPPAEEYKGITSEQADRRIIAACIVVALLTAIVSCHNANVKARKIREER